MIWSSISKGNLSKNVKFDEDYMFKVIVNISNKILIRDENFHDHQNKGLCGGAKPINTCSPIQGAKSIGTKSHQNLTLKSPMQIKQWIFSPKYYTYSIHLKCAINHTYFNCSFMVHKKHNQTTTHQKVPKNK